MFKVGDFVTGRDRSFKRSIYRLMRIVDSETGIYKPVAYGGRMVPPLQGRHYLNSRKHSEFRLADKEEMDIAGYQIKWNVLNLLFLFGIPKPPPFNDDF